VKGYSDMRWDTSLWVRLCGRVLVRPFYVSVALRKGGYDQKAVGRIEEDSNEPICCLCRCVCVPSGGWGPSSASVPTVRRLSGRPGPSVGAAGALSVEYAWSFWGEWVREDGRAGHRRVRLLVFTHCCWWYLVLGLEG